MSRLVSVRFHGEAAGGGGVGVGGVKMLPSGRMELALQIQVEELPEGLFLATADELPGLVAQGRTVAETLEIARDVARRLVGARREGEGRTVSPSV